MNLNKRIAVTVPSTTDGNKRNLRMHKKMVREVLARMSELFGGATAMPGMGGYISDKKGLVVEDIAVVYSFTDAAGLKKLPAVYELARQVCAAMTQECVAVETPHGLEFITNTNKAVA